MTNRSSLLLACVAALLTLVVAPASATEPNNESATYELRMGPSPNRGEAANGDTVEVTCRDRQGVCGTFAVHPKALPDPPSGEFVHKAPDGAVLGGGTWIATELLAFESYGCGVVLGNPIPPNFCGGMVKMRVLLDTPIGQFDGILTSFCIVGPNPRNDHDEPPEEGVTFNISGAINFNHVAGGENVYVRQ